MKFRTLVTLLGSGQLPVLLSLVRATRQHHRLAFLGASVSSGLLRHLAAGPRSLDGLATDLGVDPSMRAGLEAWLQVGVALGALRSTPAGYALRGYLARQLADPAHDAACALVQEVTHLHTALIAGAPQRLREARPFTLADQDADVIARSSRIAEPVICEALDTVLPAHGPARLLEIGCGTAAYIRHAAARNPDLTALGLELQPEVATLAAANVATWNLAHRVAIEAGDIRERRPEPVFDVATLHQNIYYFAVDERVGVLRHVGGFVKPGGQVLLTTFCQGGSAAVAVLNLWGAMTTGCGRLPTPAELVAQLQDAGFRDITHHRLIPGESFFAFVGTR